MTYLFEKCGKQVLKDGEHYADAVNDEAAETICLALNRYHPIATPPERDYLRG